MYTHLQRSSFLMRMLSFNCFISIVGALLSDIVQSLFCWIDVQRPLALFLFCSKSFISLSVQQWISAQFYSQQSVKCWLTNKLTNYAKMMIRRCFLVGLIAEIIHRSGRWSKVGMIALSRGDLVQTLIDLIRKKIEKRRRSVFSYWISS